MSANLHTFMDIFSSEVQTEEGNIAVKKIIIPIIQRDYAQGRDDPDILRVRTRFLETLHAAVTGTPITLDEDYFGGKRGISILPGPFAKASQIDVPVWEDN